MLPDETFLLRPESPTEILSEWWSDIIDKARGARATALGRPVFREEYFEVDSSLKIASMIFLLLIYMYF